MPGFTSALVHMLSSSWWRMGCVPLEGEFVICVFFTSVSFADQYYCVSRTCLCMVFVLLVNLTVAIYCVLLDWSLSVVTHSSGWQHCNLSLAIIQLLSFAFTRLSTCISVSQKSVLLKTCVRDMLFCCILPCLDSWVPAGEQSSQLHLCTFLLKSIMSRSSSSCRPVGALMLACPLQSKPWPSPCMLLYATSLAAYPGDC